MILPFRRAAHFSKDVPEKSGFSCPKTPVALSFGDVADPCFHMTPSDPADDGLPALVDLTYSATTDPGRYDELVHVWERYLERLSPGEIEDDNGHHLRHFNQALEIFEKIGRQQQSQNRAEAVVGSFKTPAFLIDAAGRVSHSNASDGVLHLQDARGDGGGQAGVQFDAHALKTAIAELHQGAAVSLLPMYDADHRLVDCAVLSGLESHGSEPERYLLVASGPKINADHLAILQDRFGLSASETDVLAALHDGLSVAQISQNRGVEVATTRTQVRKLLEKTGSATLADLIRQATQISAQMTSVGIARKLSEPGTFGQAEYDRILTADGRLLAYREFGDRKGRPVLFIHNMMGGAIWPAGMEQLAQAKGWRVIAPSRPGFGLSDSYPARDLELVRKSCSDMRALLDHLMVDQVLVVGMMSSAGLGIRFAKDHADRVRALLNVGHAGLMDDRLIDAMANPSRAMAKTYRKSPTALRFLIRVAVASVDLLGPRQMLRSNFQRSDPDIELLKDTALVDAIGEGLQHAIAQGGEAFSRDGFVALHDWREDVAALNCPATCLLGEQDAMYPQAEARRLMADLPNYALEVFPDAGQFVFYGHSAKAFQLMDRLWHTNGNIFAA
ncbi:Transcriptional regulator, LuxR family/hydrolase, alpha/beta fold family protein [Sulfitobacter noctilucicola]|nr:Transcriptional regulator, LuxR family/hydrolase, alpha/beta fold family protein [Sulfitobacter noctilucicola]